MNELSVEANISNMDIILDFINEKLENCPLKVKNQIDIVIDEIFSNIISYAYESSTGNVKIRITVTNEISIEFEDDGIPYNPLLNNDPDIFLSLDEREIGGLGIFMVKNIMDFVEYRYENNKNILLVQKKII